MKSASRHFRFKPPHRSEKGNQYVPVSQVSKVNALSSLELINFSTGKAPLILFHFVDAWEEEYSEKIVKRGTFDNHIF
jgi:hypothetical protein